MNISWLKPVLAAIALNMVIAVPILAQHIEGHHQQMMQHDQADMSKLAQHLGATPEQMEQIQAVRHQFFQELEGLKSNHSLSNDQIKTQHHQLVGRADQALRKILNKDQIAMLDSHGGTGILLGLNHQIDPMAMLAKLGLSDNQMARAKQIVGETTRAMEVVKQDKSLTPDQIKAKMMQMHESAMKRMEAILTPEQAKRLRDMHEANGGKVIHPKR